MNIPFTKTTLGEEEKKAIADVIDSGWVVMGEKTRQFETEFAKYVGAKYAVFVDSGTSALDLSVKWLLESERWKRGEFISVPSLTFTATPEVLVHNLLIPEFVDVNMKTFCIENPHMESLPVHLIGNKAPEGAILYDSAHRIERNDFPGGDILVCHSFYATKNMTTIQGGMIVTDSETAYKWLKAARDHGITKGTEERYKKGEVDYSIEFCGWREKSDDVHAAVGLEQLKKLPWMTEKRNEIVNAYNSLLKLDRTGNHVYPILVDKRPEFINFMRSKGIQCSVHFLPLHKMPAYKEYAEEPLPNTEYLGARLVSLPIFPQMTSLEIQYVVDAVLESKLLIR